MASSSSSLSSSALFKPPPSLAGPRTLESSLIGESALIDRETGRVLWEGGARSTVTASVAPKLSELGFSHLKASVLSAVLILGILGYLSKYLQRKIHLSTATSASPRLLPEWVPLRLVAYGLTLLGWTLFRAPVLDTWILICVLVLYLLEAYNCRCVNMLPWPSER
jgi:hypothetical protein